jgi:hypothetical protein
LPQRELSGVIKIEGGSELAMPTSIEISPVDVVAPTLSATVGTDGKFRFPSAMPIDYELQLSPSAGYVKSLHFAGGEATDRRLHLGSTFGPFTIEIAQGRGRVRGKVSLGSAKPVRTAVTLQPTGPLSDRSDLLLVTFADENGEFQFPAVVPGIYRVLAFADADPLAIRTPEFLSLFQVSSVSVLEGQESGIDVPLISPGEFEDAKARF